MAKQLITESCVHAMPHGGVLRVGGDVIATPAALAEDGSYVVRVVNGQAVVDRLEGAGPARFGTDFKETHGR